MKYYYGCWIYITDLLCYLLFCFHAWNVYITKNIETNLPIHYFFTPGASFLNVGRLKGQANYWKWGFFIVGNGLVFSSQIFCVTNYFVFMLEILQHKNTENITHLLLSKSSIGLGLHPSGSLCGTTEQNWTMVFYPPILMFLNHGGISVGDSFPLWFTL